MKTEWLKLLAAALSLPFLFSRAAAAPISFDDIDASGGDVPLASYAGFAWTNFLAYTSLDGFPGFNNGIVSPLNAAYSGGEFGGAPSAPVIGTLSSANPFSFVSAQLGAGYYDNLSLLIEGRLGTSLLFSQTVSVGTSGAQLFSFNFNNIDSLSFTALVTPQTNDPFGCGTFNCTQFTLDDLLVTDAVTPTQVPEPGLLMLLAIGLAAALLMRARQKAL